MRTLALLSLVCAGIAAAEVPSLERYFPMATGDEWTYNVRHKKKSETFVMQVKIEGPWKDEGQSGMIMTQKDHRGTMREFLVKTDHGIFIHKIGLSKTLTPEVFSRFTPDVPRVIAPLTPGTTVQWEGRLKVRLIMDKPIRFSGTVVGWEDVTVPAGTFHCIRLFYDEWQGDDHIQESAWYADGVGQVKYDGGQYVKELREFRVQGSGL